MDGFLSLLKRLEPWRCKLHMFSSQAAIASGNVPVLCTTGPALNVAVM